MRHSVRRELLMCASLPRAPFDAEVGEPWVRILAWGHSGWNPSPRARQRLALSRAATQLCTWLNLLWLISQDRGEPHRSTEQPCSPDCICNSHNKKSTCICPACRGLLWGQWAGADLDRSVAALEREKVSSRGLSGGGTWSSSADSNCWILGFLCGVREEK